MSQGREQTQSQGTEADAAAETRPPLVSVITAVLNGAEFLARCIQSVIDQDYENIEHIIIDGGSTDGSVDILRRFDQRIAFWISEPDSGHADAWNKGLARARGDWICFLGADDEFLPGAVSAYMRLAGQHSEADYLCSRMRRVYPSGYTRIKGEPWRWAEFQKRMTTAHPGSMHRRDLFQKLGTYDTSYRTAQDYEFLLRARGQLKAAYMPRVTVMMRAGGVSESAKTLRDAERAKVRSGGRPKPLAALEFHIEDSKSRLGKLRRGSTRWWRRVVQFGREKVGS